MVGLTTWEAFFSILSLTDQLSMSYSYWTSTSDMFFIYKPPRAYFYSHKEFIEKKTSYVRMKKLEKASSVARFTLIMTFIEYLMQNQVI